MKVSLISTVYNEGESIEEFLQSISLMTRLPDEFVIVDAGSTDGTLQKLTVFAKTADFAVKVLVEKKCNIARGRNIAISHSSHELIAVTDAGCKVDRRWLEEIVKPFEDESIDVASGWYEPDVRTLFEKAVAMCTFPSISKIDSNSFLPSSRSLAFRKSAWQSVGGYPEWLTLTAEDTLFDLNLKKNGKIFFFTPRALVRWRPRNNFKSFLKQQYLYAFGDGEARLFTRTYIKLFVKILILLVGTVSAIFNKDIFSYLIIGSVVVNFSQSINRGNLLLFIYSLGLKIISSAAQIIGYWAGRLNAKQSNDLPV